MLGGISFFSVFCGERKASGVLQEQQVYLNHHDTVKYVGMEQCRACHNPIYETFIETGMGQSFGVASRQKSAAKFGKHYVVKDRFSNLSYYSYWAGDSMYIMEFRLEGKDTVHKRIERVDYIIGSGQHTNSHMMNINGFVYQLPMTWYAQKGRWDLPPGYEDGNNVRFNRTIGLECMSCHNAMPRFVPNSMNKYVSVPGGIDCERCHGPGELHVREKVAGNYVDTATRIDYTIVNPRKLSWELQIDVCQRCHLQGNAVLKNGKDFSDFRPGKKLSDFIDIYMPKYKDCEDEFIMASHAQRLQMSKCFIATAGQDGSEHAGALTCISCHNPHVSVKVTGKQVFNNSCGKCHSPAKNNTCTASPASQKAAGYNCVQCHMPRSGTVDIPHVTVTDHWIRVPATRSEKMKVKEFAGIYCINNNRSDDETRGRAYIGHFEKFSGERSSIDSAARYLDMPPVKSTDALIHLWYVKGDYERIVRAAASLKPAGETNPWLCYRVGRAYFHNGNLDIAEAWYRQAVSLAPENLDFINALGTLYADRKEDEKALRVLGSSLDRNPRQSEPLTNIGFVYARQQQYEKALAYYDQALALDPDLEQALLNKAAVLNILKRKPEARKLLQRLLRKDPRNTMVRQLLNSLEKN